MDRKGLDSRAASTSQMGRFETEWLATEENLAALSDLSGAWIDRVNDRKKPKAIVLDTDEEVVIIISYWSRCAKDRRLIDHGAHGMHKA